MSQIIHITFSSSIPSSFIIMRFFTWVFYLLIQNPILLTNIQEIQVADGNINGSIYFGDQFITT